MKKITKSNIFVIAYLILWILYLLLFTYIVLFKGTLDQVHEFVQVLQSDTDLAKQTVYLRPFESTKLFIENCEYNYARLNLLGNIALFIPLGILIGVLYRGKKGIILSLLLGVILSLCYESIQYLYAIGEFDIDDILLNSLGSVLGNFTCIIVLFFNKVIMQKNIIK